MNDSVVGSPGAIVVVVVVLGWSCSCCADAGEEKLVAMIARTAKFAMAK